MKCVGDVQVRRPGADDWHPYHGAGVGHGCGHTTVEAGACMWCGDSPVPRRLMNSVHGRRGLCLHHVTPWCAAVVRHFYVVVGVQDAGYKAWKSRNLIDSQQFELYAQDPEVLRLLDKVYGMTGIDKLAPKHSVKHRLCVAPLRPWLCAALFGMCVVLSLRATGPPQTGSS